MFVRLKAWFGIGWKATGEQRVLKTIAVSSGSYFRPGTAYPTRVWQKRYRHTRTGQTVWRTVW